MTSNLDTISQAVQDGDDKRDVELVKEALESGMPAVDIVEKSDESQDTSLQVERRNKDEYCPGSV